eukprot:Skav217247  [mRNA]  locus=scaffold110:330358:331212:- [translate_table: standard]
MLNRPQTLPVSTRVRKLLYRTRVVPKVSWGFWWQQVPDCFKKKWTSRLRLVLRVQRSASRDLWQLLCGHWTDMNTVFEAASLLNFVRALRYWQNRGLSLLRGPWSRRAAQILQSAGFWQTQLHVWRHVDFGTASWIGDDGLAQATSVLHFLREQWRKERFSAFLHHKRREAEEALAAGVSYDDVDVKRLRLLYDDLTAEQQGVLLGASWSIAAYDKLRRRAGKDDPVQVAVCPFCQQAVVPNWLHIARILHEVVHLNQSSYWQSDWGGLSPTNPNKHPCYESIS